MDINHNSYTNNSNRKSGDLQSMNAAVSEASRTEDRYNRDDVMPWFTSQSVSLVFILEGIPEKRCALKEQSLLFDLFKAFDWI